MIKRGEQMTSLLLTNNDITMLKFVNVIQNDLANIKNYGRFC